ncbi:integrin beta-PS-like protein [Dinothrombium tinctorium]|uniref:Integrin beta n=1 Tax=Dinothrombium tinctorium TaxID=1965070 RepID=A0A3S3P4Q3_9ACAR|nr:integrin beta-PS-like protein [Dinothrombium tinctorium]
MFSSSFSFLLLASIAENNTDPCLQKERCSECITASPLCSWCTEEEFAHRRCDTYRNLEKNGCNDAHIYHPRNEYEVTENFELSVKAAKESDAVQIKPQRINLKLRPNSPRKFPVQFRQAVDYPVDLYYLMDLSKSMQDDKEKLALLGDLLASEMQRITSNFRLGFGSFVDKVAMPYVNMQPDKLLEPCTGCVKPYGFKNHMPLDTDTSRFKARLGGIIKPNDGKCHMSGGEYVASLDQDYPSVGQIHQKVKEYDVNLIFAVTQKHFETYDQLKSLIEGASAGVLKEDSSNIVDLVKEEYQKITSVVELKDNATSDVKVSYYSSCVGDERKETAECKGLHVGTTIDYDIVIEVLKCPENPNERNQTIVIKPSTLSDQLIINLEIICECDCEKEWNEEKNSAHCSGFGTYECGICSCHSNRYGDSCECDAKNLTQSEQEKLCKYRETDTVVCSGRGACRCGKCKCDQRIDMLIYGDYCECNNLNCDRGGDRALICSGNGVCDCGECKCDPEWGGRACDCYLNSSICISPKSGLICNGHGDCVCGRCQCYRSDNNTAEEYTGQFCDVCPTCPTKCENFTECVRCQQWKTGELSEDECILCPFKVIPVNELDVYEDETYCVFMDGDCKAEFKYRQPNLTEDIFFVTVKRDKDCPVVVNVFLVVIGLIIFIVLLGLLLLLLWKICVIIHDRREFAKFEQERQNAKWDTGENPIYKQATSTFKNPLYGK